MIARIDPFEETCVRLLHAFFKKYLNDELRERTAMALLDVLNGRRTFPASTMIGRPGFCSPFAAEAAACPT